MRTPRISLSTILTLLALVPFGLKADPTFEGGRGLIHVLSADNDGAGGLALGLAGEYWQKTDYPQEGNDHQDFRGLLSLTYVPVSWAEVSAAGEWRSFWEDNPERSEQGLGDTRVGLKLSSRSGSPLSVGLAGDVTFDTGDEERGLSNGARQWTTRALFTVDLGNLPGGPPSFRFHANAGYHVNQANEESDDEYVPLGVGLELPTPTFTPLIEFTSDQYIHLDTLSPSENPMRVVFGLRAAFPAGLRVTGVLDFNVSQVLPNGDKIEPYDWRLLVGLAWLSPGAGRGQRRAGTIAGQIIEAETEQPLAATVRLPQYPDYPPVSSDPTTGIYTLEDVPAGLTTVEVTKPEYIKQALPVVVKHREVSVRDFMLVRSTPPEGEVQGSVTDRLTGHPVYATLSFTGPTLDSVTTDPNTGAYQISLPSGTYAVKLSAEGFIPSSAPVTVKPGTTAMHNFIVLKKGGQLELPHILFASGKATIQPESYPGLEAAAQFLRENPDVTLEIQGHTDSAGQDETNLRLSQARADAVRNELISSYGISPDRLVARGYGERNPIASNRTKAGRRQNRRIEFRIIE